MTGRARQREPGRGRIGMLAAGRAAENVQVLLRREQALVTRNRYAEALGLLDALLGRSNLKPRNRFEALCRKADCLERLRRPREAVELLREVTREFRTEPFAFSLLGEFLYRIREDHAGALRALTRAVKLQPEDADSLWWKGQVYQAGLARFRKARSAYRAALAVDPEFAPAMASLAELAEAEGGWIEAIDWRKSHYRLTRFSGDLVVLADLYLRLDNSVAALKYARRATRRASGDSGAWLVLAKALAAGGRFRRAVKALKEFSRRVRHGSASPLSSRDIALLEPALSRTEARKLLRRMPVR